MGDQDPPALMSRLYRRSDPAGQLAVSRPEESSGPQSPGPKFNTRSGFKRPHAATNGSASNNGKSNGKHNGHSTGGANGSARTAAPTPKFFKPKPKVRVLPPGVNHKPVSDFAEGDPLSPSFSQKKPLPAIEDDGEAKIGEYSDPSQNPFAFIQAVKSGSADFLEFVYLRPRVMGKGEKSPYNLEVVPSSAVTRDDYYTLGLSGVTHFSQGKAEFTPLERWQREYRLHGRLLHIPFFRKYRRWKSYFMWHKQVRSSKMNQASNDLSERLFILSPILREALLRTRELSQTIQDNKLHRVNHDKPTMQPIQTYSLQSFEEEQKAQKQEVEEHLEDFSQELVGIVATACGRELDKNFPPKVQESPDPKSMNFTGMESKEPPKMTFTEISTKRAECRKLTNFIRLCDYLVVDTLRELVWSSTDDVLKFVTPQEAELERVQGRIDVYEEQQAILAAQLERARMIAEGEIDPDDEEEEEEPPPPVELTEEEKAAEVERLAEEARAAEEAEKKKAREKKAILVPLFVSELVMKNGALVFEPSREKIIKGTTKVLDNMLDAVASIGSLTQREECRPFTAPQFNDRPPESFDIGEGLNLAEMIQDDSKYTDLTQEISDILNKGFDLVDRYSQQFEPFRKMYLENTETDARSFVRDDGELSDFVGAIVKFTQQTQDIAQLKEDEKVGLLNIDTRHLKGVIAPAPTKCLSDIHALLPVLAQEDNYKLSQDVESWTSFLTTAPKDVGEFVDYLDFLEKTSNRLEKVDEDYERVRDIYALIEEHGIQVPDQQLAEFRSTRPSVERIKNVVDEGEGKRDEEVVKFNTELDKNIESLKSQATDIKNAAFDKMLSSEKSDVKQALEFVTDLYDNLDNALKTSKTYTEWQMLFGLSAAAEYEDMEETMLDVGMKKKLWSAISEFDGHATKWEDTPYSELDAEETDATVMKYGKTAYQVQKALQDNDAVPLLRDKVDLWKETAPILVNLKNDALEPWHWQEMSELLGLDLYAKIYEEHMTVKAMVATGINQHAEKLEYISVTATQERVLNQQLQRVIDLWATTEFIPLDHKAEVYKDVYILGGIDDITLVLEDTQVAITTILGSRYVGRIRDKVDDWDRKLKRLSETIDEWVACQRQWMYLESIFASPDIQAKLPNEAKLFEGIDKSWKDTMRKVKENPIAINIGTRPGLLEMFQKHNENLDVIQKNLEMYLEQKRLAFPRFYFLGDDDLLDILSQSKNPEAVQPHMGKMFDGMKSVKFQGSEFEIVGLVSNEAEYVELEKPFKARGEVERWLVKVEENMRGTLFRDTKQSLKDFEEESLDDFVAGHICMVVLTAMQIIWSQEVEECLKHDRATKKLKEFYELKVTELESMADMTRLDLSKNQRKTLGAVITIFVHARDVVEIMIAEGVSKVTEFGWTKQLRYVWDATDGVQGDCFVRMTNTNFRYGYEYLGCQPRLVITPLTDRVYITVTGAINLCLGAAPAGPAGTGKTESTKDLAKAMAYPCIVYNCSDGVTYLMVAKFFSGLVQTGSWACFDEFNRINIEVLSVIASQMLVIRNGLLAANFKESRFMFEGREMRLIPTFGAIITMNPGYAGRTELPDNLKVLFRSVAVMVPDYQLIAEVILFSEGFYLAKKLSVKMKQLYKLASEQLSAQDHYDFGMRAVKSVLVMAGGLKRANPDQTEDIVLLRAMVESNVPKFISADLPLFYGIVSDLFPGVSVPKNDYGEIGVTLQEEIANRGLQPNEKFIGKIIEFYDICIVRHGVALVGPTGGGKTQNRGIMSTLLTELRKKGTQNEVCQIVHQFELNPKSISMAELYGYANPITNEWTDGIVAATARVCIKPANSASQTWEKDHKWILYDGPIDTLWIESMNSVLDDSKLLCLDSGERIKLNNSIHMIFECMDLSVASPATVSRLGMVFMDPDNLGWIAGFETYLTIDNARGGLPDGMNDEYREYVRELCEEKFNIAIPHVLKNYRMLMPLFDINLVGSFCDLFRSLLMHGGDTGVKWSAPEDEVKELILLCWGYAFIWGIGGNISTASQQDFSEWFRENNKDVPLGPEGLVFDYFIDFEERCMKPYLDVIPSFTYDPEVPYFSQLVPTIDTVRFSKLVDESLMVNKPILLNGTSGVGKSVMVNDCLMKIRDKRNLVVAPMQFSAQTSAARTQEMIATKLEKKRKTTFGAPVGKRIALFVDDMNMPKLEQFGAAPPIELLRQLKSQGGFYDREKLFFMDVQDVVLLGCCGEPGGGKNHLTPRFVRYFHVACVPETSRSSMATMFTSIFGGFLRELKFAEVCQKMDSACVQATINLYHSIVNDLLPTPARCHYTFNLRDVSKVFQGMLKIKPRNCSREDVMIKLWAHEAARCFHDRLINKEDKEYFYGVMGDLLKNIFSSNLDPATIFRDKPVMFGDYMKGVGTPSEDRMYEEITDKKKLIKVFTDYLDDFNLNTSKPMPLVLFMDCVDHVSRTARVIRQKRGNALLVGVGGSGKQSVTRLASHVADAVCTGIELTRGYNGDSFKEDIKRMFFMAGVDGLNVTFLFTDSQIVEEGFVEDINNILNSGEVPNLFELDEKMKIIDGIRPYMKENNYEETAENCYKQFILRVRDNLHMCLCMSPVGEAFRQRCRMFPSLVNCCTIDWFNEWPSEALLSVAKNTLDELDVGSDENKENIIKMCVDIHSAAFTESELFWTQLRRRNYVTPTSYLEFIKLYQANLDDKRGQVARQRDKLANGLRKLAETEEVVADLQEKITKLQPELKQKSEEATEILGIVATETEKANVVRVKVQADEKVVSKQAEEANAIATDAQADLDKALPAMNSAVKALESLNKGDIGEMKGYKTPPDAVVKVLNAVLLLFGYPKKKQNWDEAKVLMTDSNFLNRCKGYDKDNIGDAMIASLKVYIEDEEFDPDYVRGKSSAAASLCMWVRAMDVYAKVAKDVEPKKAALKAAKDSLNAAQSTLKEKQDSLAEVENKLQALEDKQNATLAQKKALQEESDLCTGRMDRAGKLTNALGSEKVRWKETVEKLGGQINECVGSVFLAAAFIGYLAPFDGTFRQKITSGWVTQCQEYGIPVTENFSLYDIMADPVAVRQWHIDGLPYDNLSVENGIVVKTSRRWSMMIDPQGQARYWIGRMEKSAGLKVMKPTTPNSLRIVEACIRNGNPLVLEDAGETLDPSLEPVLLKQVYKQQGRLLLRLGDGDIDYDPAFKFYVTTKLPNPHYAPELCIKVTVVNFMVTFLGLEDQLLAEVVMLERPDLEDAKNELIKSMAADKKQITELEDKILTMLKEAEGNILDNVVLIDTLEESKKTSNIIAEHLAEAERTNEEISAARAGYTIVATRGSILYFVVAEMSSINDMYQFSLDFFKALFKLQIELSEKSPDVPTRCNTLIHNITKAVYASVCRGLFEKDKLILSFLFTCNIMRKADDIKSDEWMFFIRGSGLVSKTSQPDNPDDTWITESMWDIIDAADRNVEAFSGLCADIDENMFAWKAFITATEPQNEPLPGDWDDNLNYFQKLLLINATRPEKMMYVSMDFIKDQMGSYYIEPIPVDLIKIYPETTNKFPTIFVFTTGSDPTDMLMRFALEEKGYGTDRFHVVSLGQGQGPKAEKAMAIADKNGDWVFLQNCHLASTFMPRLEAIIESWSADGAKVDPDFRLWLSTMPTKLFPISVLQNGIKITTEAPRGLRANMNRSYFNLTDKYIENSNKASAFKKLIFGCVYFHAIIQERKKFGPVGWNIKYEFNDSDLETSLEMVKRYLDESPSGVPWETANYMLSEISYGGRVTDDKDRRLIASILKMYYNEGLLSDDYKFSTSGIYYAPPFGKRVDYLKYIEGLPYQDDPEAFGMHENANISFQMQESGYMLDTVLSVMPKDSGGGGGGKTSDEIVSEMTDDLLENMPEQMSPEEDEDTGQFDILETGLMDPMATVVSHEMNRFNKLLHVIVRVLKELQKALKGLVVMSDELDVVYTSFVANAVPPSFAKAAYPSLKNLANWVIDLYARIDFIRGWVRQGIPVCLWISGFYFPQGFMTGMLQTNSRKYGVPIDTLGIQFTVTKTGPEEIFEKPEDGSYMYGMYMDGGRLDWNETKIEDSLPGVMYTPLPVIKFTPVANFVRDKADYSCPLYKTMTRAGTLSTTGHSTNFVVMVDIPTDKPPDYWVLKGVAGLCALRD